MTPRPAPLRSSLPSSPCPTVCVLTAPLPLPFPCQLLYYDPNPPSSAGSSFTALPPSLPPSLPSVIFSGRRPCLWTPRHKIDREIVLITIYQSTREMTCSNKALQIGRGEDQETSNGRSCVSLAPAHTYTGSMASSLSSLSLAPDSTRRLLVSAPSSLDPTPPSVDRWTVPGGHVTCQSAL